MKNSFRCSVSFTFVLALLVINGSSATAQLMAEVPPIPLLVSADGKDSTSTVVTASVTTPAPTPTPTLTPALEQGLSREAFADRVADYFRKAQYFGIKAQIWLGTFDPDNPSLPDLTIWAKNAPEHLQTLVYNKKNDFTFGCSLMDGMFQEVRPGYRRMDVRYPCEFPNGTQILARPLDEDCNYGIFLWSWAYEPPAFVTTIGREKPFDFGGLLRDQIRKAVKEESNVKIFGMDCRAYVLVLNSGTKLTFYAEETTGKLVRWDTKPPGNKPVVRIFDITVADKVPEATKWLIDANDIPSLVVDTKLETQKNPESSEPKTP